MESSVRRQFTSPAPRREGASAKIGEVVVFNVLGRPTELYRCVIVVHQRAPTEHMQMQNYCITSACILSKDSAEKMYKILTYYNL